MFTENSSRLGCRVPPPLSWGPGANHATSLGFKPLFHQRGNSLQTQLLICCPQTTGVTWLFSIFHLQNHEYRNLKTPLPCFPLLGPLEIRIWVLRGWGQGESGTSFYLQHQGPSRVPEFLSSLHLVPVFLAPHLVGGNSVPSHFLRFPLLQSWEPQQMPQRASSCLRDSCLLPRCL